MVLSQALPTIFKWETPLGVVPCGGKVRITFYAKGS